MVKFNKDKCQTWSKRYLLIMDYLLIVMIINSVRKPCHLCPVPVSKKWNFIIHGLGSLTYNVFNFVPESVLVPFGFISLSVAPTLESHLGRSCSVREFVLLCFFSLQAFYSLPHHPRTDYPDLSWKILTRTYNIFTPFLLQFYNRKHFMLPSITSNKHHLLPWYLTTLIVLLILK